MVDSRQHIIIVVGCLLSNIKKQILDIRKQNIKSQDPGKNHHRIIQVRVGTWREARGRRPPPSSPPPQASRLAPLRSRNLSLPLSSCRWLVLSLPSASQRCCAASVHSIGTEKAKRGVPHDHTTATTTTTTRLRVKLRSVVDPCPILVWPTLGAWRGCAAVVLLS